jgi:hypothetical protein
MADAIATEPRASLLKLADYCIATPAQRRRILQTQKHPPDVIVIRYTLAENAIAAYMSRTIDVDELAERRDEIADRPAENRQQAERFRSCAAAIDAAIAFLPSSPLASMTFTPINARPPRLDNEGVSISVQPDLWVQCPATGRRPARCGLLKFRFGKTEAMHPQAAQYAGAMLRRYGDEFFPEDAPVDYRACFVYDVMHDAIHTAPLAVVRTWATIDAACLEYATMWDVV